MKFYSKKTIAPQLAKTKSTRVLSAVLAGIILILLVRNFNFKFLFFCRFHKLFNSVFKKFRVIRFVKNNFKNLKINSKAIESPECSDKNGSLYSMELTDMTLAHDCFLFRVNLYILGWWENVFGNPINGTYRNALYSTPP